MHSHTLDRSRSLVRVTTTILAAIALAACGSDGVQETLTAPGPDLTPPPLVSDGEAGLDQLIENFAYSYDESSASEYEDCLAAEFTFVVEPPYQEALGFMNLSRSEDIQSTTRMFNGEEGQERVLDPGTGKWAGTYAPTPPVSNIRLELEPASGAGWQLVDHAEYGRVWRRAYEMDMRITYAESTRIDQIYGQHMFHVGSATVVQGGEEIEVWQLLEWMEFSFLRGAPVSRAADSSSIAALKSWF